MSSSDSQDERTVYTKGKKLKRTTKSMTLVLSDEEAKYRKQNFKNVDVIADYSDKLQCTKCFISIKSAVIEGRDIFCHPLLKVLMCKKCIDFYGSGEFSLDEDDEDKYCRWCGQGGTLLVCSKCICGFCPKCIQKHFGKEKKKQVEKDDDWICFFCKPDWLFDLRAICALAVEASNKNRKELRGKRESRLLSMKNKASTSQSRPKRNTRGSSPSTSTSEKGNTSEPNEIEIISSSDEREKTDKETAAEKGKAKDKDRDGEREKSKTPKIVLKRKRGSKIAMACKVNGKALGVDTSSEGTSGETRGRKKQRTSLTACGVTPKEKKDMAPKKELDSDSSSSENEEDPPAATISAPSKQVTKSLNKLTDLFKLTEMTSQLCYNVCKKHLKKLENKNTVITNEKLIKESEKLKTVLTMLSTNLNTVSSTVSSLQNKLGVDEKNEDDSQTNNENDKLKQAIEDLNRSSEKLKEALEDDLKWYAENCPEKEEKEKDVNDADDDDSEKDSEKSEVLSGKKTKEKKKRKKEKRNKKRKKESDEDSGSESGGRGGKGATGFEIWESEEVKKKSKKSKKPRKGSNDEESESDAEVAKSKPKKNKNRKKGSDGGMSGCEEIDNDEDDNSKKFEMKLKIRKKRLDSEKDDDGDVEKVVREENNVSDVEEVVEKVEEVADGAQDDGGKSDNENLEQPTGDKSAGEKIENMKKIALESSSSEEEKPSKKKKCANVKSEEEKKPSRKEKSFSDNGSSSDEAIVLKKEKRKKEMVSDDDDKEKTEKKHERIRKSSGAEEKDIFDSDSESELGKGEVEALESEKCDKLAAKDEIKLREVKVTLTRIALPKDCDSVSLNETTGNEVYDVETEDDEKDDDAKKMSKTVAIKSSSDEDESLDKKKKPKKKKLLDSDEEDDKESEGKASSAEEVKSIDLADSSSDDAFLKKNTKKPSLSDSEEYSDGGKKNKWRRIRSKKAEKSESSSDSEQERTRKRSRKKGDKDDKDSPSKGRKNIKRIIKKDKLHVETKQALKNEEARKERIKEREKEYKKLFPVEKDENGRQTRLVLDFDPETKEPTVEVHSKLVKKLKPHQIEGVKFMWDSCFESIKKVEEDTGSGCILAHCMGLGKTLQVVTLVHTVMTHDLGVNTTLVVCPLNTVANWIQEFEMWLANVHTEPITLYDIIKYKKDYERTFQLKDWHKSGGVMVISYDMFRNLTKEQKTKGKKKKKDREIFEKTLLDPGPDLVICDEGHLLKNEDTALSKCMRQIATSRRIVLTGTPLQNNLIEYHCMVQFIKPNILGTKKEFSNRFVNPINNGQFEDSTEWDVKVMKRRSHVLHTMLDGCVQRFDYSVLTPFLPKKYEYVISIPLSESQAKLYKYYLDHFSAKSEGSTRGARLFNDYHHLQRIWTHPRTLLAHDEKEQEKELFRDDESEGSLKDFVVDDDEDEDSRSGSDSGSGSGSRSSRSSSAKPERKRLLRSNANDEDMQKEVEEIQQMKEKKWWDEFITEKDYEDLRASYKLVLLFSILKESKKLGDKVLVFSQSLYTLNLIEYFLERITAASKKNPDESLDGHSDSWVLGRDYFRLDGSTSSEKRHIWTKYFNKEKNKEARLFLISTRAGGLGINLTAANRVIIFDASWNPSHDVQSIFRVYRFGQTKTCYIYRFLAEATMEEKIYERQVTKLSLAHRVVDEHQIERHYTMNSLIELYAYEPTPPEKRKTPMVPKDELFADILTKHKEIIVGYHEHDSLLENKQEEVLTEEERKAAWEDFEKERTARPQIDPLVLQQQQLLYQRMQAQMQAELAQKQGMNMGNFINNAAFIGAARDNLTRLINPMALQYNPLSNQGNPSALQAVTGSVISNSMLHRGQLIGLQPFANETPQSFFYRIRERENAMVRQQQQQQQQALLLMQHQLQQQQNLQPGSNKS